MRTTAWSVSRSPARLMRVLVGIALVTAFWGAGDVVRGSTGRTAGEAADQEPNGPHGTVWVVNRDRGELAIFDASSGEVLATRLVGAGAHDICVSERAGKAYITAETVNTVTAVDLRTLAIDYIPVGPLPHHIEPSPDGRTIYVTLASHSTTLGAPQYAAIDTEDHSVTYVTSSVNPLARAHGPQPSLDGDTLYVAHDTGDELTAVDTQTGDIDFSIGPILRAEEVIPTRFGRSLWVSSRGDGTVKRIDLGTRTITASVPVGVQPESVMLTPSERTLVVSLRGSPAAVAFVDTTGLQLSALVPIGGTGSAGNLGVITNDGRFVFATVDNGSGGTGAVAVIDVRTQTLVGAPWAYPGTGRPHGVWYSRKRLRLDK